MLYLGRRSILSLMLLLDQVMYFPQLTNPILIVGLDDQHTPLNKALPVLARPLVLKVLSELEYVDRLIKLVVIYVELDKYLKRLVD